MTPLKFKMAAHGKFKSELKIPDLHIQFFCTLKFSVYL